MTINKKMIKVFEKRYWRVFSDEFKKYLLAEYSEEPFPYCCTEECLDTQVYNDICAYEAGKLDVTVKSPAERWKIEREYLQDIYLEKDLEVQSLTEYVNELERLLLEHGLESAQMVKNRTDTEAF